MTSRVPHRPVGAIELFFDLVFVFAVTQVTDLVRESHDGLSLARGAIVFVVIYWLWAVTAIQATFHDGTATRVRLTLLLSTFTALLVALSIPEVFEETSHALVFSGAYWVGRAVVLVGLLRGRTRVFGLYLVSLTVSGPLLFVGALTPSPVREAVWALVAVVEVLVPRLQRGRMRALRYDSEHVVERFGLLVLIALGESIVGIGEPLTEIHRWSGADAVSVVASFAVVSALWWLYFDHSDRLVLRAVEAAAVPFDAVRGLLAYGHLWIISGVIMVAAALHEGTARPDRPVHAAVACLLPLGAATCLGVFVVMRRRVFHSVYRSRLLGAVVLVALAPLALVVPALLAAVLTALVLGTVITWEALHPTSAGIPSPADFAARDEDRP